MGRKKFLTFIIIILFLAGITAGVFNHYYSLPYLINRLLGREFYVNPRAKINPERSYTINIWYYPFFRTITDYQGKEKEIFNQISARVKEQYPNIELNLTKLDFFKGRNMLEKALKKGRAPDIYLNFSNDSYLSERWQVPIEAYVSQENRTGYYSVNWENVNRSNHLWGWPFLCQKQFWVANSNFIDKFGDHQNFISGLKQLEEGSLSFNYYDYTLLRQFLSLNGLSKIKSDNLKEETRQVFNQTFEILAELRGNKKFASQMPQRMLKDFFSKEDLVIGPVNPWLNNFLREKGAVENRLSLPSLYRLYTLSVFRQEDYEGHDHTRAVMEVARIITKDFSGEIAENMGLQPAFNPEYVESENLQRILEITPEAKELWYEKIIPAWISFWEEDLSPEEAMDKIGN